MAEVTDKLHKLTHSESVDVDLPEFIKSEVDEDEDEEVVEEGFVVGGPNPQTVRQEPEPDEPGAMPDDNPVDFDLENKDDGEKAQENARHIKMEFEPTDVRFWFSQLEAEMLLASVNTQWLKKLFYKETCQINKKKT